MVDRLVEIKNNTVKKFGPVLGYVILIAGALAILSVLGFLLKSLIKMVIVLAIGAIVVFGAYKLYELMSSKKAG
jgi:uncharacterized membrane protein